jgi:ribosomal protein S7
MFLKKLLKLLIKKGKLTIAVKNLSRTLRVMRGGGTAPSRLNFIMFRKLAPLVKIYKKKVAGKVYQLPWRTTRRRAAFQAAKWILLAIEGEKKGKNLSVKIGKQFVKTLKDKGLALKLRSQFVDIIRENRSYMRFIKKKRIKRRRKFKGRFRNRFTKKSLKNYIFFKFYKKNKKVVNTKKIKQLKIIIIRIIL